MTGNNDNVNVTGSKHDYKMSHYAETEGEYENMNARTTFALSVNHSPPHNNYVHNYCFP